MIFARTPTDDGKSCSSDEGRIGRDEAFVDTGVVQGGKLNLQFPVVWLFVEYLKDK